MTPRQRKGLELWVQYYQMPANYPWCFESAFNRVASTVIEIGFGMGGSLLEMARTNPHINYIGIEVHQAGVGSLAMDLYENKLSNVRIVSEDAVEVLTKKIANGSVDGFQIFFPDPWPKKRHHKRRLIQPDFLHLLVQKMKPGAFLHCATDWQNYADHMLAMLSDEPELQNTQSKSGFSPKPVSRPVTKFEKRGQRLGHAVRDLIFIKHRN